MKSIFYWLLLITIFKDLKISQCGVIRRDLTWKKESEEAPNINIKNSHSRLLNLNTDQTSHIPSNSNVHNEKPIALSSDFPKMLNLTKITNRENLTFDTPLKEGFERPIRSSEGKQCRLQLLTYNPIQFTSHDLYNHSNTDSQIPSNRTERHYVSENQPEEKTQQPAYLNKKESRKTKLDYSNKEYPKTHERPLQGNTEVCVMQESKIPAQVSSPNTKEYVKIKGHHVKTEKSSETRSLIRSYATSGKEEALEEDFAQEKECCAECIYEPGGIHLKEISNPYEKNDNFYRLNDEGSESDDYVIKVQHPYGIEKQYTGKENLVKNDMKEYHVNTPTDNVQEDFASVNTYPERAKYAPIIYYDNAKYPPTDRERSQYKYPVKKIDTSEAYESNDNAYTLRTKSQERVYFQEQVHHPQQKELNMLYTPKIISNNPSGYEHHKHSSYYTSNNKQFNENYNKQIRGNPFIDQSIEVYHHDSEAKHYLKRPAVNQPSIREIIFPSGGYLQAGEYIFHDKSNSSKNNDECALNPRYKNVIDRITINSGGHIHKGKYAFLDGVYSSDGQGEDYYGEAERESIERVKRNLDGLLYDKSPTNSKYNLRSSDKFDVLREMNDGIFSDSDKIQKILHKRSAKPALVVFDANLIKPVIKEAVKVTKNLIDSKTNLDRKLLKIKVDNIINTIKNKKLKPLPKLPSLTDPTKISHHKILPGILPYHKKDSLHRSPMFSKDIGNHVHAKETVININKNYGAPILPQLISAPVKKHAFDSHYVSPREYDHSSKVYFEKPKYVGRSLNPFTNNVYNRDYFRTSHNRELDDQPNKFDLLKSLKLPSIHVPEPMKLLSKHYDPSHRAVVYPDERYPDHYDRPYKPIRHYRHEPVYQIAPRVRHQYHNSKSVVFENTPPSLRLGRECRPVIHANDPQPEEVEYAKYGYNDVVRPNKDRYYGENWLTDGDGLRQPRENLKTERIDGNLYYTKKNYKSHPCD